MTNFKNKEILKITTPQYIKRRNQEALKKENVEAFKLFTQTGNTMTNDKLSSIVSMVSGFNGPLVVPVIELVAEYKWLVLENERLKKELEKVKLP
jgi:hypothetical protein